MIGQAVPLVQSMPDVPAPPLSDGCDFDPASTGVKPDTRATAKSINMSC